jgi:hypothetical protein
MAGGIFDRLRVLDAYPKTLEDFRIKTLTGALITITCLIAASVLFVFEFRSYMRVDIEQELFVDLTRSRNITINLNITFPHLTCEFITVDTNDLTGNSRIDAQELKKFRVDKNGIIKAPYSNDELKNKAENIPEKKIDSNCLTCYGAESPIIKCCNTCDDVRKAYKLKNWHFSPFGIEQCKNELHESSRNLQAIMIKDPKFMQSLLNSEHGCQVAGHLEVNKVAGSFHLGNIQFHKSKYLFLIFFIFIFYIR